MPQSVEDVEGLNGAIWQMNRAVGMALTSAAHSSTVLPTVAHWDSVYLDFPCHVQHQHRLSGA